MQSVHARVPVCVCTSVRARSHGLQARPWGRCCPGRPRGGGGRGARVVGGAAGPTRGRAHTRAAPALCVPLCGRRRRHHFCFARDRHIKGKAAAAHRRPLSLRCPLLQVYYYSTGRAASPRGPGWPPGCGAPWPPSRLARPQTAYSASLFVWKAIARRGGEPARAGRGRAGARALGSGAGPGRRAQLRAPLSPRGPAGSVGEVQGARGAGCRGARVGRSPTGPRVTDSCRVSSLAPPRQHSGSKAGALAPCQSHQN